MSKTGKDTHDFDDQVKNLTPDATKLLRGWNWEREDGLHPASHLIFKEHICMHCYVILQADVVVPTQLYPLHELLCHVHTNRKASNKKSGEE